MDQKSGIKKVFSFFFRLFRVVVVLIIAIALARLLISLKKEPEKKQLLKVPPAVKVIKAAPVSKTMDVEAFGTVRAKHLVKIVPEIPGKVDDINDSFVEGGFLQKGEILLRIEQRKYLLDRDTARTRIVQARTDLKKLEKDIENLEKDAALSSDNLKLAEKEFKRLQSLNSANVASQSSVDRAEQQVLQAKIGLQNLTSSLSLSSVLREQKKAALEMAEIDLEKAEFALEKTVVRTDFNAFVLTKSVQEGEYINPGQVLGSVYEKGLFEVDVGIPLEKIKWIESGFEGGKLPEADIMLAHSDGAGGFLWKAKVARIKAGIDEKTRTLPMTLEISVQENGSSLPSEYNTGTAGFFDLRPGAFVKCTIYGQSFNDIFVVSRHLVRQDNTVFIFDSGRLKITPVHILRKFGDDVYIDNGLSPGDQLIVSPLPGADDGMELILRD